jgi:hypothetical protein
MEDIAADYLAPASFEDASPRRLTDATRLKKFQWTGELHLVARFGLHVTITETVEFS